ncbi:DUF6197 family protein [Rhodococcus sp. NPDC055024]
MSEVSNVLNHAADLLEHDGWTQGMLRNYATGCRCALGALNDATNDCLKGPAVRGSSKVWRAAEDALRSEIACVNIPIWNDTPGRTATEVIAALRNAAKDAA